MQEVAGSNPAYRSEHCPCSFMGFSVGGERIHRMTERRITKRGVSFLAAALGVVMGSSLLAPTPVEATDLVSPDLVNIGNFSTIGILGTPTSGIVLDPVGRALTDADGDYLATPGTIDTSKVVADAPASATTTYVAPAVKTLNTSCANVIKAAGGTTTDVNANCLATINTSVSPAKPDLAIAGAIVGFTRYCRRWTQSYNTPSYGERHIGKFCYDRRNARVWPWGGYHYCGDNWGFGYVVDNTRCFGVKVEDPAFTGGYYRQLWDWTKMSLIFRGFPYSFTRKMHTNIFPSGRVVLHDN